MTVMLRVSKTKFIHQASARPFQPNSINIPLYQFPEESIQNKPLTSLQQRTLVKNKHWNEDARIIYDTDPSMQQYTRCRY
jgi:hypothetical protein